MVYSFKSSLHNSYQSSNIRTAEIAQAFGSGITAHISYPSVSKTISFTYDATHKISLAT